jgi:hypothetical protein
MRILSLLLTGTLLSLTTGASADMYDPRHFVFPSTTDAPPGTTVESGVAPLAGSEGTKIEMWGGVGSPLYRICRDADCSSSSSWTADETTIDFTPAWLQIKMTAGIEGSPTQVVKLAASSELASWNVSAPLDPRMLSIVDMISDPTLAHTLAEHAGGAGPIWQKCAVSRDGTVFEDIEAKCKGDAMLVVYAAKGVQFGTFVAGGAEAVSSASGGPVEAEGFLFTQAHSKSSNILDRHGNDAASASTFPVSLNGRGWMDPVALIYNMQSGVNLTIAFKGSPSYPRNAWNAGFRIDGGSGADETHYSQTYGQSPDRMTVYRR